MLIVLILAFTWLDGSVASAAASYKLPIPSSQPVYVTQGNWEGDHRPEYGNSQFAFDFAAGAKPFSIVAARAGKVIGLRSDSDIQCKGLNKRIDDKLVPGCWAEANYILIDHGDNTAALYLHLEKGSVVVNNGDTIQNGQQIATAGTTGWSTGIHLHFQVETTPCTQGNAQSIAQCKQRSGWWWTKSVQISFSDKDVLTKNPDGIPVSQVKFNPYTSDNTVLVQVPPTSPVLPPTQPALPNTSSIKPGMTVAVMMDIGTCLNVRKEPSTSSAVQRCILPGTPAHVINGPKSADGHSWWLLGGIQANVHDPGFYGWVVEDYLTGQAYSRPNEVPTTLVDATLSYISQHSSGRRYVGNCERFREPNGYIRMSRDEYCSRFEVLPSGIAIADILFAPPYITNPETDTILVTFQKVGNGQWVPVVGGYLMEE